jgi:pyruvate dehydrogenase E2 component (dihydrolipoamide acetyltransferase)
VSIEFVLPELGENVEKGDVVRVLIAPGDFVRAEQPVLELETDKATIEVPSSVGGRVTEVKVKAGDKVKVGQVMFVLDPTAAKTKVAEAAAPKTPPSAEAAPAKASEAAPAKPTGPVPVKPAAAMAEAGTPKAAVVAISTGRPPAEAASSVPAAPSVRRYARELGVDITQVTGSGPGGRIEQDDVREHVKAVVTGSGRRSFGGGAEPSRGGPLPDFSKWGEVDIRPMSNVRRKTAEHVSIAWQAPHVTQHDKADVTSLEAFRTQYGPRVEKAGGKLTVTAIVIKVVAAALARFPQFASSVDMAEQAIVFKKYCHIGVAADTPNGLLVPVIRDADRKTITEIAVELATLSQKARDRKLSLDEMSGGVFSITNLGGIGGTLFTPIINQPEVAILGLSRTAVEPVYHEGQLVPRHMLPLSLSYDHRAIDGADAARFLRFVAEGLEQPMTMQL